VSENVQRWHTCCGGKDGPLAVVVVHFTREFHLELHFRRMRKLEFDLDGFAGEHVLAVPGVHLAGSLSRWRRPDVGDRLHPSGTTTDANTVTCFR
jgi:hypothetical protein